MPYKLPVFRLQLVKEGAATHLSAIKNPGDVVRLLRDLEELDREQVVALYVNVKNQPIGKHVVSIGTLNASFAGPREVYKAGILATAYAVILVHNHPSGDATPSAEDDALTQNMANAGHLLGIKLLDHVIIASSGEWFSYETSRDYLLKPQMY